MKDYFSWECECGNIEHGSYPPKECKDCQSIGTFVKIPDEIAEQMEAKKILSASMDEEDEEDLEHED